VTDDVSSAPPEERSSRRGIAGDLVVFKAAGAAAAQKRPLDDVVRIASKANDHTRSFGVAFSGCTLPGAEQPLFTVPDGRMAVGMGIHGEPGIDETDVPSADELADLLVDTILKEVPEGTGTSRVAVILNGLGSVKYEELFVVYRRVGQLLSQRGLDVVEPEVGELVTSFDMAGVSLTLAWLDGELDELWRAPAASAAYRKLPAPTAENRPAAGHHPPPGDHADGHVSPADLGESPADIGEADLDDLPVPPAGADSRAAAPMVLSALDSIRAVLDAQTDELGRLDAIAGDGDHGIGMQRGATAAQKSAHTSTHQGAGAGTTLARAADAWADRAGGTSGALWGVILRAIADELGDDDAPDRTRLSTGVRAAAAKVSELGGAQVGDKTLLDVLVPFAEVLAAHVRDGDDLRAAWTAAADVARERAEATAALAPRLGRARSHTAKSVGSPDAGAVSLALITEAVRDALFSSDSSADSSSTSSGNS
ncbi:dihydroxyacetone kinase family protein, partial [Phytoactinopolyspora endophytica]|uniref:dihydroxyacetone kinase family protein n=1 Tax=Phytoactinopolyspora endophytica TaxID=1642495 RepID=UPI001F0D707B